MPIRIVIPAEWVDWLREHEEDIALAIAWFFYSWLVFAIAGWMVTWLSYQWARFGWLGMLFPLWLAIGYLLYRGAQWLFSEIITVSVSIKAPPESTSDVNDKPVVPASMQGKKPHGSRIIKSGG